MFQSILSAIMIFRETAALIYGMSVRDSNSDSNNDQRQQRLVWQ